MDRWDRRAIVNWSIGFAGASFETAPAAESPVSAEFPNFTEYLAADSTRRRRRAASPEPGHQLVSSFHNRHPVGRNAKRRDLSGQYAKSRSSGRAARISIRESRDHADQGPGESQRCDPGIRRDDPAAESRSDAGKNFVPDRPIAIADRKSKRSNYENTGRPAAQPGFTARCPSEPVGTTKGSP